MATDYNTKIKELWDSGMTVSAMVRHFNTSSSTFFRYMKELGYDTSRYSVQRKDRLVDHKEEIIQDYNNGLGCYKLAAKYKTSESSSPISFLCFYESKLLSNVPGQIGHFTAYKK